ncbi:MAG: sigma-54 dependent transcriptional regulator [Nitrospira sp.]|nr:sigma-54-dependent Fis family transcriptional regulator [Candidatus Manganitrophaceae bacterium]HIL35188.1 sigma-54-dependent Fis family transcriptional regulator [Candidatus Manganitrophaceae bacterium]
MSEAKGSVLIVDDDREMRKLIEEFLQEEGYDAESVASGDLAIRSLQVRPCDLLITDLRMEGLSGLELLKKVKAVNPQQTIIMITAFGTVESAIEVMKFGALDYIIKPFKLGKLIVVVEKAFEQIWLQKEVNRLRVEVSREYEFSKIIGKSKEIQAIFQLIKRVSDSTVNILITGESGTGKEMVAKAIHYNSPRKEAPFIPIDCASIPEMLLESELFGHVRGAFTDARFDKKGMFEEANGGTLFLDEIGEMPLGLQPKLLRVIQEKTVRRVGSTKISPIDIRIISATNLDLMEEVRAKRFRDDLFYRVNVLSIDLPPLRNRREDIPLLAGHFLKKYAALQNKEITGLTVSAIKILMKYGWPGNVRELENIIERGVTLSLREKISAEDFPPVITGGQGDQILIEQALARMSPLAEVEREYVYRILQLTGGNKMKAAKILQIDRHTLYKKLEDFRKQQEAEA